MYEVFSMTRAGRPRWALLATAALFLLTTLLAAILAGRKAKQATIILGEIKPYRALSLRAGFPSGWEVSPAEKVGGGYVVLASAPGQDRHLLVFRMRPAVVPRHLARAVALERAVRSIDPQAQVVRPERQGQGSIGALEGETYLIALYAPALGSELQVGLANVAVTPDRQILGVLLVSRDTITSRDRRLIQAFSQSVSYEGVDSTVQPRSGPRAPVDDPEEESPKPVARLDFARRAAACCRECPITRTGAVANFRALVQKAVASYRTPVSQAAAHVIA